MKAFLPIRSLTYVIFIFLILNLYGVFKITPLIGDVLPNSQADQAGLLKGDLILEVEGNGKVSNDEIKKIEEEMKKIAKEEDIPLINCAFVGDGHNDIYLAKAVGLSIAFNAHQELIKVCNKKISPQSCHLYERSLS